MYSLQLSSEQLEIRDTVRDFVTREIKPVALKAERLDACDRSLLMAEIDAASQLGLRTLALSLVSLAEVVMRQRIVGIDVQDARVFGDGFVHAPQLEIGIRQTILE